MAIILPDLQHLSPLQGMVEELARAADGSTTVLIRRRKTDPEGAGVPLYLAPNTI